MLRVQSTRDWIGLAQQGYRIDGFKQFSFDSQHDVVLSADLSLGAVAVGVCKCTLQLEAPSWA